MSMFNPDNIAFFGIIPHPRDPVLLPCAKCGSAPQMGTGCDMECVYGLALRCPKCKVPTSGSNWPTGRWDQMGEWNALQAKELAPAPVAWTLPHCPL